MSVRCCARSARTRTKVVPPPAVATIRIGIAIRTFFTLPLILQPVDRIDDQRDALQVPGQQPDGLGIAGLDALLAQIEQSLEGGRIDGEMVPGGMHDLAPDGRDVPAMKSKGVAK